MNRSKQRLRYFMHKFSQKDTSFFHNYNDHEIQRMWMRINMYLTTGFRFDLYPRANLIHAKNAIEIYLVEKTILTQDEVSNLQNTPELENKV